MQGLIIGIITGILAGFIASKLQSGNGKGLLEKSFSNVDWREYEDSLYVTDENDLIDYILSCHGNQNQYIVDNYKEFRNFVHTQVGQGFHISKEAWIFICREGVRPL